MPAKNAPILIHIKPCQNDWFKYTFLVNTNIRANKKAAIKEILKLRREVFFFFLKVIKKLPKSKREKARISFVGVKYGWGGFLKGNEKFPVAENIQELTNILLSF